MPKFEMYVEHEHGDGWCALADRMGTEDGTGRIVRTKLLSPGTLQYARRTGEIGISSQQYQENADPKHGDWREIPDPVTSGVQRAQPDKPTTREMPEGIQFE